MCRGRWVILERGLIFLNVVWESCFVVGVFKNYTIDAEICLEKREREKKFADLIREK